MHASQLAEMGSWVALHSGNLIFGSQVQPMLVATKYWTASKLRLHRWNTALKMFEEDMQRAKDQPAESANDHDFWPALQAVAQEILVSEILTRVWSATMLSHDRHHQTDELTGLAHSVYLSHLEAKNRVLRLILSGRALHEPMFDRINMLRRRMERWTDLFLGQLPMGETAAMFSFDRNRVKDFYTEQRSTLGEAYETRQRVLNASFAADLLRDIVPTSANPDLNREIASGVLACYPADRFDSLGLPKSTRMIWLEKAHTDAQVLIDQLVQM